LLLIIAVVLPTCRAQRRLQHVEQPETGYVFPAISEISGIEFQGRGWGYPPDFPVPQSCWPALLESLSPSQRDEKPAPWIALGVLRITTQHQVVHSVDLYRVFGDDEQVGAFSAAPADHSHQPFRGGSSARLERALKDAHSLYLKQSEGKGK
jgi:hypothetical protein